MNNNADDADNTHNETIVNDLNNSNNSESGMLTSIWGNSMWNSLHCISFTYPVLPSDEDKKHYKIYFESLKYVLPCCVCRKHYTKHTQIGGDFEIVDDIFESRHSLSKWVFDLHKNVNESLGMIYDITYEDIYVKYNSYIATCNMSTEKKITAYSNAHDKEAPFVSYDVAIQFANYAKIRGLDDFVANLNAIHEHFKSKRETDNKISDNWIKRNSDCWNLSKHMRTNGILGFEKNNEYNNLPTIEELQMLQMLATTLSQNTLNHMIEKLKKINFNNSVD